MHRADLLSDLRRPAKGSAYQTAAGPCWYVIRQGIAKPDETPSDLVQPLCHTRR